MPQHLSAQPSRSSIVLNMLAVIAAAFTGLAACAQSSEVSVGRGAPLAASLPELPTDPTQLLPALEAALQNSRIVGPLLLIQTPLQVLHLQALQLR
jgi:hypothetical protein